jgi:hypothetical protein
MTIANLHKFTEQEKRNETDAEGRRENGMVLVVTGWLLILFGIMVALFFHPSSPRFSNTNIRNLALLLAAVGIAVRMWGNRVRRSAPSKY